MKLDNSYVNQNETHMKSNEILFYIFYKNSVIIIYYHVVFICMYFIVDQHMNCQFHRCYL